MSDPNYEDNIPMRVNPSATAHKPTPQYQSDPDDEDHPPLCTCKGVTAAELSQQLQSLENRLNSKFATMTTELREVHKTLSINSQQIHDLGKAVSSMETRLANDFNQAESNLAQLIKTKLDTQVFKPMVASLTKDFQKMSDETREYILEKMGIQTANHFKEVSELYQRIYDQMIQTLADFEKYVSTFKTIDELKRICQTTCEWFESAYRIPIDITNETSKLINLISQLNQTKIESSSAVKQASAITAGIITLLGQLSDAQSRMEQISSSLADYVSTIDKYGDNFLDWQKVMIENSKVAPSEHQLLTAQTIIQALDTANEIYTANRKQAVVL